GIHCGNSDDSKGGGNQATSGSAGMGATSGTGASGGTSASGGAGGKGGSAGRPPNVGGGIPTDPGGQNCGLGGHATVSETFNEPAQTQGRAGELDATKWSAARNQPQIPTAASRMIGITQSTLPSCRDGIPTTVFPSQDTVICDPNDKIASFHMLVAVA